MEAEQQERCEKKDNITPKTGSQSIEDKYKLLI